MIARVSVMLFTVAVALVGIWLLGYHEGEQTSAYNLLNQTGGTYEPDVESAEDIKNAEDIDRDHVCNEIRRYKESIARDLDEHTQICGWPDMDGESEKSN